MAVYADRAQSAGDLPPLPLAAWRPTKETLHLYCQVVGKIRKSATAPRAHRWNVPLYVAIRGLTTGRMRYGGLAFAIDFDFLDHRLVLRTDVGRSESFALRDGLSVKDFYDTLLGLLQEFGARLEVETEPVGVPGAPPHDEDTEHSAYDPVQAERFWRVLAWVDGVFEEFSGWFSGKTSPVHLFWHDFDLAVTRYSGRRVQEEGKADPVAHESYTHEVIGFGFSPAGRGTGDASFYSYTHPEPPDLTRRPLRPAEARWIPTEVGTHLAVLAWEDVRTSADPRRTLLAFLQSSYEAGGITAGWEMADLESVYTPEEARIRR
ncbi:MAG TPA: DUF5996 family protein [Actinomadura sp.]|jgi:hypothetical protein|nr:DUF5996 family protein [Actinomadura sp.]